MSDRVVVGCRVDEDVLDNFRTFTEENNGHIRGEMGRNLEKAMIEYMDNDRAARIERKVDELHEMVGGSLSEESLDGETNSATSSNGQSNDSTASSINQRTKDSLTKIRNEIPENTVISESLLETAIENHAGHAYKTLERYKTLLKNRGHILEHPVKPNEYATSQKTFAIICENSDKVTLPMLRDMIADRMDLLGEEWYLESLPPELMKNNHELKVDQVMDTHAYRQDNGLLDGTRDRGVQ